MSSLAHDVTSSGKAPARRRRSPRSAGAGRSHGEGVAPSPHLLQRALEDPQLAGPEAVLALQQVYGNQAVQRLVAQHRSTAREVSSASSPLQCSPIQRALRWGKIRAGDWKSRRALDPSHPQYLDPNSASSYKKFRKYPKNDPRGGWEIVFRGLKKISDLNFEREEAFNEWESNHGIDPSIATSWGFIATGRDPAFSESVSGAGGFGGKVVYAALVPSGFGIDVEAYSKQHAKEGETGWARADQAKEVAMLRMPRQYIIGWRSTTMDRETRQPVTAYHANPEFVLPEGVRLEEVPSYDKYRDWKAQAEEQGDVEESVMRDIEEQEVRLTDR